MILGRRLAGLLTVLLLAGGFLFAGGENLAESGLRTAEASGLLDAPCPAAPPTTLQAWFRHEPGGKRRVAEAAVLLPVPVEEAIALLEDVNGYPGWLLVRPDGDPNLGEVSFDQTTGSGFVRLRDPGGPKVAGRLSQQRGDAFYGLRIELPELDRIDGLAFEAAALARRCDPPSTILTARVEWSVGLLTRLFADESVVSQPASHLLAIRGDVVARLLGDAGRLSGLLGVRLEERGGETVFAEAPPGGEGMEVWPGEGDRLVHAEPCAVRMEGGKAEGMDRISRRAGRGQKVKAGEFFEAFWKDLSGPHEITGHCVTVPEGEALRLYVMAAPGDISHYMVWHGAVAAMGFSQVGSGGVDTILVDGGLRSERLERAAEEGGPRAD